MDRRSLIMRTSKLEVQFPLMLNAGAPTIPVAAGNKGETPVEKGSYVFDADGYTTISGVKGLGVEYGTEKR